jgi:hypothetical protein
MAPPNRRKPQRGVTRDVKRRVVPSGSHPVEVKVWGAAEDPGRCLWAVEYDRVGVITWPLLHTARPRGMLTEWQCP